MLKLSVNYKAVYKYKTLLLKAPFMRHKSFQALNHTAVESLCFHYKLNAKEASLKRLYLLHCYYLAPNT